MESAEASETDEEPGSVKVEVMVEPTDIKYGSHVKVLVVGNDEVSEKILCRLLTSLQYDVTFASSGYQAQQLIHNSEGSCFDAIFADEQISDMAGIEFTKAHAKSRWSFVPVLLMCPGFNQTSLHEAIAAGAKQVLPKPIQMSFLKALQAKLKLQRHLMAFSRDLGAHKTGHGMVKSVINRAVSLDNSHILPNLDTMNTKEFDHVKPLPQRASSMLPAKSLPPAYDIKCFSLPPPLICKDFLKTPMNSAPKLQIQPLDITKGLVLGNGSAEKGSSVPNGNWPAAKDPSKSKQTDPQKEAQGQVAASLSQLHHSQSSSAFQTLDKSPQVSLSKAAQPQLSPPAFVPTPPKVLQAHQQRFAEAYQAAMKQHKQAEACAANRKAAILRFRAKREQRSFQKKVRYASRKRLADQRPRIKGQFVKAVDLDKGSLAAK